MSEHAIEVKGISKAYQLHQPNILQQLKRYGKHVVETCTHFRSSHSVQTDQHNKGLFWALNNINFEIKTGDVVGIIGHNGAGKSTLLKILSRITAPTHGEITIRGEIGSILEVGTGFNPQLTGRDNIYLSASILGMDYNTIRKRFDEIIDFASIPPQFINVPVKFYSSGMYMRLAFAVASHLKHEILLIDEALAVGDENFQKKCTGRLQQEASSGRTVLFVSHNMASIQSLCNKTILLEKGRISAIGKPNEIVQKYYEKNSTLQQEQAWKDIHNAPGNHLYRIKAVRILDKNHTPQARIMNSSSCCVEIEYWITAENIKAGATIMLHTSTGICVFSTVSNHEKTWHNRKRAKGLYRSRCTIPADLLIAGNYYATIMLWSEGYLDPFKIERAIEFEVYDSGKLRGDYFGGWDGVIQPRLEWVCDKI